LPGQPARPAVDAAVDDDPCADPGADREIDEVGDVAEQPALEDGGWRGAGVVLDRPRDAEACLQPRAERQSMPAEVDGKRDLALDRIDPARDADADRGNA